MRLAWLRSLEAKRKVLPFLLFLLCFRKCLKCYVNVASLESFVNLMRQCKRRAGHKFGQLIDSKSTKRLGERVKIFQMFAPPVGQRRQIRSLLTRYRQTARQFALSFLRALSLPLSLSISLFTSSIWAVCIGLLKKANLHKRTHCGYYQYWHCRLVAFIFGAESEVKNVKKTKDLGNELADIWHVCGLHWRLMKHVKVNTRISYYICLRLRFTWYFEILKLFFSLSLKLSEL